MAGKNNHLGVPPFGAGTWLPSPGAAGWSAPRPPRSSAPVTLPAGTRITTHLIGLFRIHISSERTPPVCSGRSAGQKRSPCAGCMIRIHSFAEPNFDFDLFFVRPSRVTFSFLLDGSDRPSSCSFSVLLVSDSTFSTFAIYMCETKKNKKEV